MTILSVVRLTNLDIGNFIMNEKMEQSLEGVLINSLRHCARFRLSQHDFSRVSKAVRLGLASRMLDWLEEEIAASERLVSGGAGSRPSGSNEDMAGGGRNIIRSQPQAR